MKLIKGEFKEKLDLQLAPSIKAGFPSPAEDYLSESIDFNRDMIKHPEATFYGEVEGDSMIGLGINDGDIAVIDRSIEAEQGDIVVAYINGEFNVKQLDLSHKAVLFGIKATDRVKSFLFRFIAVPAKWVRTARQYKLNIYSAKPYNIIWEHG